MTLQLIRIKRVEPKTEIKYINMKHSKTILVLKLIRV